MSLYPKEIRRKATVDVIAAARQLADELDAEDREYGFSFSIYVARTRTKLRRALHDLDAGGRRKPDVPPVEIPPTSKVRHGSTSAYTDFSCRCRPCRDAISAYHRAKRRAGQEQ